MKAMSEREASAFLAMAVEDRRYVLFLTLLRSGLRIGEGLGLQLGDVDVANSELSVKRTLSASARGVSIEDRLDTPKSGEAREVEIGDELAETLRHQIARRREENLKRGQTEDASPWLFATTNGTPLDETRVRKAFKATLRKAGLPLRSSRTA